MMTASDKKYLAGHPLFSEIPPAIFRELIRGARRLNFKAGALIYEEGWSADYLFLVLEGRVKLVSQKQDVLAGHQPERIVIQTLKRDDIMGWSVLVPPYRWQFDTYAAVNTKLIRLDGKRLRERCEKNHDLGYKLLKRITAYLVERLNATRMHLLLYGGQPFTQAEGA